MANTFSSRNTLKTKLLTAINAAGSADQIVKLSRSIEKANLDDDADLETALDTKVSALAGTASTEDIEKLAFGVKKLRTPEGAGVPTSTMIAEGSTNLYVTQDRVRGSFSASGDLSYDSGTGVLSYTALPDALTVYATVADLPASGVAAGSKGIVEENKKLYVFTGASWVGVGLVDQKPSFNTNPDGSYSLTPGGDTVITLNATDPQGDPITYSHQVTAGSLGGSTISQADNVFTITGSSNSADAGSFSITFTASDGTNLATTTPSEFTLAFGFDWDSIDVYDRTFADSNPSHDRLGKNIASTSDSIVVSAPMAYGSGLIKIYDADTSGGSLTQTGYIYDGMDNNSQYHTAQGGWNLAGWHWLAADGDYIAFCSDYADGVVDVWNISDQSSMEASTLHKCIYGQDFAVDQADADRMRPYSWGTSGDLKGNYLAIGDREYKMPPKVNPGFPYPGQSYHGKVWVFDISTGGVTDPTLLYSIERPDSLGDSEDMYFGSSISISSSGLMAVSAPKFDLYGNGKGGRAFIYNVADGSFVKFIDISQADILPSTSTDRLPGDQPNSIKLSDDGSKLVVGDSRSNTGGSANGIVSVYDVSTGTRVWHKEARYYLGDTNPKWGEQVDISSDGEYVLFSAMDAGNNDQGKMYFAKAIDGQNFTGGPNTWELSGPGGDTGFGSAVHFSSDKVFTSSAPNKNVYYYD